MDCKREWTVPQTLSIKPQPWVAWVDKHHDHPGACDSGGMKCTKKRPLNDVVLRLVGQPKHHQTAHIR